MLPLVLTLLVIGAAAFHIWSEYRGQQRLIYVSKPLTTLLILLIAFMGQYADPFYKYMILIGLVFSLAGDIFLMLPSDPFVAGLGSFLVAHLFYIAAFASETGALIWWPIIPLAICGILVYRILAPSLGNKKLPVLVYLLVIMVMVWLAWEMWGQADQIWALAAFIGAILFVISDTILAFNRFRSIFGSARALYLATYFAAQWFIASSLGAGPWEFTGR